MTIEGKAEQRAPRIRLGMVGGGIDAFIGGVHRIAARLDDRFELVAGALSSTPERSAKSGAALGLDPERTYGDFKAMAIRESRLKSGIEAVASEATYQRARLLRDMGRTADASAAFKSVAARYPSREVAAEALWEVGWAAYLARNPQDAEHAWTRISEIPGGRAHRVRALYWAGRARKVN